MRTMGGSSLRPAFMKFDKPALTIEAQIDLLLARGLVISDRDQASHYLTHLNYYRLGAYWLPFELNHTSHQFKPDTQFDAVLNLYLFDREFRLLVMDAIERIEVSIRAVWAYQMAYRHGAHCHLRRELFKPKWNPSLLRCTEKRSVSQQGRIHLSPSENLWWRSTAHLGTGRSYELWQTLELVWQYPLRSRSKCCCCELWTRWKDPDIPTPSSDDRSELLCPPRKTMESRIYSHTNVTEARNVIFVQNRHSKNLQYINFDTLPDEPNQPRASLEKTFDGFTKASQYRYSSHGVSKWLESSTVMGVLM